MSYPDPIHHPTPITVYPTDHYAASGPLAHRTMAPTEIPPGVQMVTLPGGVRTLAYTDPTPATLPAHAGPAPRTPRCRAGVRLGIVSLGATLTFNVRKATISIRLG